MSKKILFIGHSARLDGAERCYLESIKSLALKGMDVVALLPTDGPLCEKLDKLNIRTIFFEFPRWMKSKPGGAFSRIIFTLWQTRLARKFKPLLLSIIPDIVITNTVVISPFAAIASNSLGIPHYWYIHEFGDEDHNIRFTLGPRLSGKMISKYSEAVLVNSEIIRKKFSSIIPEEKLKLLYYAVENDVIPPTRQTTPFNGLNDFNILLLGRMFEKKGQLEAVQSLKQLQEKGREARLTLVGGGKPEFKQQLRETAETLGVSDSLEIVDFTPNPMQYLADTDLVLMCSQKEAFGRVTVEAMKYGKPVVGGNVGASPEIINDGFNGLLYEHGNPADLAEKILFFMDHIDKLKEMGENARSWSNHKFNYESHGNDLLRILSIDNTEILK